MQGSTITLDKCSQLHVAASIEDRCAVVAQHPIDEDHVTGLGFVNAQVDAGASAFSAEPHSPQKLCPGGLTALQEGQSAARAIPHEPQNLCPAGFSAPQLEHVLTSEEPSP